MKGRLFLWTVLFVIVLLAFIFCNIESFADYSFLSPECNAYLGELKEKFRVKEIVLKKEEGIVWTVKLPRNDGVETKEIRELVYNDETGQFEGPYNFTYITITNAKGWTSVIWGLAADMYPYYGPKLCFVLND